MNLAVFWAGPDSASSRTRFSLILRRSKQLLNKSVNHLGSFWNENP
jgi:hypothetical protein